MDMFSGGKYYNCMTKVEFLEFRPVGRASDSMMAPT